MGKSYEIDLNTIDINSWNKFVDNNEEIKGALNTCCSNVADIIANCEAVNTMVSEINSGLAGLKKVSVSQVPDASSIISSINSINDGFKQQSLIILTGIAYAEKKVHNLDISDEETQYFDSLLKGLADSNMFWAMNEILKNTNLNALGFCFAYGTDMSYEGGNFVVGDGARKLFDLASNKLDEIYGFDVLPSWVNLSFGTFVVAGYNFVKEWTSNKGDRTNADYRRTVGVTLSSALSYAEWYLISDSVTAVLADAFLVSSAVAGPVGVIAAGLIAIPTSILFKKAVDIFTGDNIIYEYTVKDGDDEKTYKVPANGLGKNGEFSAMVDVLDDRMPKYEFGDRVYSDYTIKEELYKDYNGLIEKTVGMPADEFLKDSFGFDYIMEEIDKVEDPVEAYHLYNDCTYQNDKAIFMSVNYGFDIVDYLEYTRGIDFDKCLIESGEKED